MASNARCWTTTLVDEDLQRVQDLDNLMARVDVGGGWESETGKEDTTVLAE
jgi:hypothetical protein